MFRPVPGLLDNKKIIDCVIVMSEIPRLSLRGWQGQPRQSQNRIKTRSKQDPIFYFGVSVCLKPKQKHIKQN
jgi:hypothetical protein